MGRIWNDEFLTAIFCDQFYGFVGEDRERDLAVVTNDLNTVGLRRFMGTKAPGATAGQAIGKLKRCTDGILRLIQSGTIAAETIDAQNRT